DRVGRPPPADRLHLREALRNRAGQPHRVDLQLVLRLDLVRRRQLATGGTVVALAGVVGVGVDRFAAVTRVWRLVDPGSGVSVLAAIAATWPQLEVQVRSGRLALVADTGDVLTRLDRVAGFDLDLVGRHVAVHG